MTKTLTQRKPWVDALRAIAIIFVVMGHQAPWWDSFFTYTTPIKIPLFFALSGYLFNSKGGDCKEYFLNLLRKLVFPYFCLVTIPALIYALFSGIDHLWNAWYNMISGGSYWFMTCLIVAETIHFFIRKYCHSIWLISLVCLLCALLGLWFSAHGILNFGTVNTALICQVYLLLGLLIRKYDEVLGHMKMPIVVLMLVLYLGLCYVAKFLFNSTEFNCHRNVYYCLPYCWLLILIGCVSLFILAKKITSFPRWLSYIGQNTMIIYLWAGHAMLLFVALRKIGVVIPEGSILMASIETLWACFACLCAASVINRYAPIIVGKKIK